MGLDEGGWSPLHEPRLFRTFPSGGSLGDYLDNLITSIFFFFKENTQDYSKEKCPSSIYFLNRKTTGGAAERGY